MIGGGPRPGGACSTAEKREREGKIYQVGGRNSCHREPRLCHNSEASIVTGSCTWKNILHTLWMTGDSGRFSYMIIYRKKMWE